MELIDALSSTAASWAVVLSLLAYLVSLVLREARGPQTSITTLRGSRPLFTTLLVLVVLASLLILALRLGVLS